MQKPPARYVCEKPSTEGNSDGASLALADFFNRQGCHGNRKDGDEAASALVILLIPAFWHAPRSALMTQLDSAPPFRGSPRHAGCRMRYSWWSIACEQKPVQSRASLP